LTHRWYHPEEIHERSLLVKRLLSFRVPLVFATLVVSVVAISTGQASAQAPADPLRLDSSGACPYYYVCVYQGRNEGGPAVPLGFYYCRTVNLADWGFSNITSSLINNQTDGTVSYFYDDAYSSSTPILAQRAYGYRQDLAYDTASDGNNSNDRIDRIKVC
jgi:hypothetical protein